jgi:GNAT superfamily N-acetyltransferase
MEHEVRLATLEDEELFRELWMEYLEEQHRKGSMVLPSESNLAFYAELFRFYVSGKVPGICVFAGDYAVTLNGSNLDPLEIASGEYSYLWGVYVRQEYRGKGVSHAIHKLVMELLPELGFEYSMTHILAGDEEPDRAIKGAISQRLGAGKVLPYANIFIWELRPGAFQ